MTNPINKILSSLESNDSEVTIVANDALKNKTVTYTKINGDKRNLFITEVSTVAMSKAGNAYMRGTVRDRDNNNEECDKTLRLENITLCNSNYLA